MIYNLDCEALRPLDEAENNLSGQSVDVQNESQESRTYSPQLMILYETGDINSALRILIDSLHDPFNATAVATVLIEEGIRQEFEQRVIAQMRTLTDAVSEHPAYMRMLQRLKELNVNTIVAEENEMVPPMASPVLVCDCTHDVLGLGVTDGPTGAITMHTFSSTMQAIEIYQRDTVPYVSSCIWNETLEGSYELVASINCKVFFINCNKVDLSPISRSLKADDTFVVVANGFHYETLRIYEQPKVIIFPIRHQIVNKPDEKKDDIGSTISFLEE
ncbi:uncharacterized protein Dwil_GK18716 [Drosophila willistoni]|uniref:Uncharacterized protein n=2 Tax=Drosophila willistoni TaxID=7260 RepID=B4N7L1_DROWI|nr:uncharacterized protein Dwil_GK18716 [Drosophila willistoni]